MAWVSMSEVANAITHAMLLPCSEHRASADAALRSMRRDAINLGDCCVELLSTPAVTLAISDVQLLDHLLTWGGGPTAPLNRGPCAEFDFFNLSTAGPAAIAEARQNLAHELDLALAAALLLQGLINDGMWSEGAAFSDKPMVLQRMHQLAFGFPLSVFTGEQHARWTAAVATCGAPTIAAAWAALGGGEIASLRLPALDCPEIAAPVAVRAARTRTRVIHDTCPLPVAAAATASVNQVDRIVGIALDALAAMCVCEYPTEAWDALLAQAAGTADAELGPSTVNFGDGVTIFSSNNSSGSFVVAPMQKSLRALSWAHRCAVKLATSSASNSAASCVGAAGTNSIARNAALPRNFAVTAPLRLALLRFSAHILELLERRQGAILNQVQQRGGNLVGGGLGVVDDAWHLRTVAWGTAAAIITSTTLTCSLGRRALAALTEDQRHAEQLRSEIAAVATQFLSAALRHLAPQLHIASTNTSDPSCAAVTLWAPQLVLLLGRRTYGVVLQSVLAVVARTTVFSHDVGAVCESLLTQLQQAATPLAILRSVHAGAAERIERRLTTAMHAGIILETVHSVLESAADEFFAQIPAGAVLGLLVRVYCAAPGNDDLSFLLLQPGGSGNGEDAVAPLSAADVLDQLSAEPLPPSLVALVSSAVTTSAATDGSPTAAFAAAAAAVGFQHEDQRIVACLAARVQNKFVGGLCPTDDATIMHARVEAMSNEQGLTFADTLGLAQSALAADMADSDATTVFSSGDASGGGAGFAANSTGAAMWDAVGVSENLSAVVELVAENDAAGTAAALVSHVLAMYAGNGGTSMEAGTQQQQEVTPYVRAHGATSIVLAAAKTFTTTGAAFDRLVDAATGAQMVRGFLALVGEFFLQNPECIAAAGAAVASGPGRMATLSLTVPGADGRPTAAPWTRVLLFSHIAARALVAACSLASSAELLALVVATCSDVCGFLRRCAYVTSPLGAGADHHDAGPAAAAFRLVAAAAASSLARAVTRSPATRAALEVPLLQEGLYGVLLRATLGGGECGDVGAAELTAALFERASPAADRWLWAVPIGAQAVPAPGGSGTADAREAWAVLAHLCQDLIAASAGDRMRATAAPALGRLLRAVVELHELPASGADVEAHEGEMHADPSAVPRRCTVLRTLLEPLVAFVGALPSLDGAPAARVLCERLRQLLVVGTADCNCGLHYAAAFGALTRVALADAIATPTDATVRFAATCVAAGSMRVFEARLQHEGSAEAQARRAQATLQHLGHIASWVAPMCALAEAPALWSGAVTSTTTSMACTAFGTLALRGCFSVVADPTAPNYGAPLADGSESALEPFVRRWLTATVAGMVRLIKFTARDVDYQGVFTAIAIIGWYVPSLRGMLLPSCAASGSLPYSAADLALLWGTWLSLYAAPSCELRLKCFTTIALAVMYQPAVEEHTLAEAAGGGAGLVAGPGAVSVPVIANIAEAHLTLRGAAAPGGHHTIARTLAVGACAAGASANASAAEVEAAAKLPPNTGAIVGRTLLQAMGETWRYVACVLQAAPHLTPPPAHHPNAAAGALTSPQTAGVRFSIASVASLHSGGGGRGADHASPYVPRHSFVLPSPGGWHDADASGVVAASRVSVASDCSLVNGHSGVHSPSVHLPRPSVSAILAGTINSGRSAFGTGGSAPPRSALARKPTYFVEAPYAPLDVGFDQASVTAAGHFLNSCLSA